MSLNTLFNPTSIAIVGVSHDPKKVGHLVAKNLLDQGYKGEVYFINKDANKDILGKKVYSSIGEIGKKIDLAVLAIPARAALPYLDEVHPAGVENVVLFAAGFKETVGGQENEKVLVEKLKQYDINLLGPNCIGYINTLSGINTTFLKHTSPKGNIGFVSQSGALGSVLVDYFAAHKNLGFSYFMSLGNKTSIDESDCIEFLVNDPNTAVIAMYLEDIKDGEKFKKIIVTASRKKPIVVLKSGTTDEGSKAAISHTGGLVGNDQVYDAVFKQYGVIRAQTFTEFMDILKLYSFGKLPSSREILILSNAGGVGVLFADDVVKNNLSLETISQDTQSKLVSAFSEIKKINPHNPIDLLGDASAFEYKQAIESTLGEKSIGAITVLLTPQANTQIEETAKVLVDVQKHFVKPIFPIFMGEKSVRDVQSYFEENRMASFLTYDHLSTCLSKMIWRENKAQKSFENHSRDVLVHIKLQQDEILTFLNLKTHVPFLNLRNSMAVLSLVGLPVEPLRYIDTKDELNKVGEQNFPLVAKIASDIVTHKTEISGVVPNIKTRAELSKAFEMLVESGKSKGIYVQKMVSGHEVFVGAKRDSHFGIVIVMGLGGIYAELLKEISYRVFPFSPHEFETMISETKVEKLVKGFRGGPPINIQDLYNVVYKLGSLLIQFPQIKEIDINPLFVSHEQIVIVDCRIVLGLK